MRAGAFALLMLATVLRAPGLEQEFADIETPKGSYTNVYITGKSDTHLFIAHNGGKAAVRIRELSPEDRARFGLNVASVASPRAAEAAPVIISGRGTPASDQKQLAAATKPAVASDKQVTSMSSAPPTERASSTPEALVIPSPAAKPSAAKSSATKRIVVIAAGAAGLVLGFIVVFSRRRVPADARLAGHRPQVLVKTASSPKPAKTSTRIEKPSGGGLDAKGRCTMSEEAEAYLKEKFEQQFPFRAARFSLFAPAFLIATAYLARTMSGAESQLVLGVIAMLFIALGFCFGVYALWNIKRLGSGKLLIQGVAGTLMNGFLILLVITSFDRIKKDFDNARAVKARTNFVWDPTKLTR